MGVGQISTHAKSYPTLPYPTQYYMQEVSGPLIIEEGRTVVLVL
jgi:hypothetical protein